MYKTFLLGSMFSLLLLSHNLFANEAIASDYKKWSKV